MNNISKWFEIGEPLIPEISQSLWDNVSNISDLSADSKTSIQCSAQHYIQCLMLSSDVNKDGKHAIALSLTRQSIEALTLIECGFLKNRELSEQLIDSWVHGKKSSGAIRKKLSEDVWPSYTLALWGKTWTEYFGGFCSSIQPYSHYSRELQGWQLQIIDKAEKTDDDSIHISAKIGFETYDANKATRITLIHILLNWTLGKIITNNIPLPNLERKLNQLQNVLETSEELGKGNLTWDQQLWSLEFTQPNSMI